MFDNSDIIVTSRHEFPDHCMLGSYCSNLGDPDEDCEGYTNQNCFLLWYGITVNSTDPYEPPDM